MNLRFLPPVLVLVLGFPFARAAEPGDETVIRACNDQYLNAFLACDVARYRALLADDFRGVLKDGRSIDKAEFLRQAAEPPRVSDFRLQDVQIRVYGDAAVVNGRVSYTRSDGSAAQTRYVDVYLRRDGHWQVVSAQLTPVASAQAARRPN